MLEIITVVIAGSAVIVQILGLTQNRKRREFERTGSRSIAGRKTPGG